MCPDFVLELLCPSDTIDELKLKRNRRFNALSRTDSNFPHLPGGQRMLNIGDEAPSFSLSSDEGKKVTLKDLLAKTLVLYFFPKADTPG